MGWPDSYAAMTLGDMIEIRDHPWACGCSGGPPGSLRCYCELIIDQAAVLHRGAHIVAKLIQSAADRDPERN
jgi:hypothetical protein